VDRDKADFHRLAEYSLKSGQFGTAWLLNEGRWQFDYPPLTPLVLDQFLKSELYRACLGESGGEPREQFEAAVLEMERVAHPPLEDPPVEHLIFVTLGCLLATYFLMESAGTVTKEREAAFMEFFDLKAESLDALAADMNWRRGQASNTRELLEKDLTGRRNRRANIHCVQILGVAFEFAIKEHGGQIPGQVQAALLDLGPWCSLAKEEVSAICETIMQTSLEKQEKDE
jgi:hypothetical protein